MSTSCPPPKPAVNDASTAGERLTPLPITQSLPGKRFWTACETLGSSESARCRLQPCLYLRFAVPVSRAPSAQWQSSHSHHHHTSRPRRQDGSQARFQVNNASFAARRAFCVAVPPAEQKSFSSTTTLPRHFRSFISVHALTQALAYSHICFHRAGRVIRPA